MVDGARTAGRGEDEVTSGTMHDVTDQRERLRAPRSQGEELVAAPIENNERQHSYEAVQSSQRGNDQPRCQEEGTGAGDAVVPDKEKPPQCC